MNPYKEYQSTEYDWLPKVPRHWNKRYLFQVNDEQSISNKNVHHQNLLSLSYGNIIKKDINSTKGLLPESFDTYQVVHNENIILRLTDLQNDHKSLRVGFVTQTGIITSAYTCLKPKNVSSKFIHYLLHAYDLRKVFYGMGGGLRQSIGFKELKYLHLYIPSLPEQDQIVKYLDFKISKINKFIKDKKREIELLKELKQAEINHAVTKGLNPNVSMKNSGINWLGEMPEHWEVRFLSQVCKEQSILNKTFKNQNLLSLSYGKVVNKDINTTEGLLPASFDTYQVVDRGNIILRLTDLQNDHKSLRTGLVTQTGIITSAYTCILPNSSIIPEYLHLLLHSFDVCKVFYGMGGGLRQSIGFKEIRRLFMLLPPMDEQKEIIKKCYVITSNIEKMISGIESEISLTQEYKNSLTCNVVTGKVDVRNVTIDETFEVDTLDEIEAETEEVIEE